MDLLLRLPDLQRRVSEHKESLLTEEAAKTAFVMPFLQALGYDVFNPGEVIPEFTCDVGTKKGEKVDYAICRDGKISILIECKPSSAGLNLKHTGQLFRYFSVTDARLAILTNGVTYQFYSDIEQPNKMDAEPFFTFHLDAIKPTDHKVLERFTKTNFDIDAIVQEAGGLKLQLQLRQEIEKEIQFPSDEFVMILAKRVHGGRLTPALRENFAKHVQASLQAVLRDLVSDRISSALKASDPPPEGEAQDPLEEIVTTDEEWAGFRIVQAIGAKLVDPKRIVMRDAKSYCAVLLDDNNRKTLVRLHFNAASVKYVGTFVDRTEERHLIMDPTDIYSIAELIEQRIRELEG
ncbi:type I restriction endonuclease [Novosphingobium sp.]|uniref:type I restriction endonuclease n=1 Tax=Novosphingobium sp. TaxID=1874826 RepID=UPI00260FF6D4|nr:type I restriction endonuclease [Novosphingobium sp.]